MIGLVNREREQARLDELWRRPGPSLALIYGRRRVGKTYFLQSAMAGRRGIYLLAAESTSSENLDELLAQIRRTVPDRTDINRDNFPTWRVALRLLCDLAAQEPLLVVFDEFSYLVHGESSLPSVIQAVWDGDAITSRLKLVLCGSELGLLSALDNYGQPLYGRFDWIETYQPLDYYDAGRFIRGEPAASVFFDRDLLVGYGILGGSGRYLAAVDPTISIGENVARLILDPHGIFHREGENLIRQERDIRDFAHYNAVLEAIATGATEFGEIANQAHLERHSVSSVLARLGQLGWVSHEKPFEEPDRRGIYHLEDNFLKFWFRFVFRLRSALQMAEPNDAWRQLVGPQLDTYLGQHVFETICAQYLRRFSRALGLPLLLELGRWWNRTSNIEIDLLGKLADGRYVAAECKWSRQPIDSDVLFDLQHKLALAPHQRWRVSPVLCLFSSGGFSERLVDRARQDGVTLVGPLELSSGPT